MKQLLKMTFKKRFVIGLIFSLIMPAFAKQEGRFVSSSSKTLTPLPMNFFQQLFTPKDKRTLAEIVGPLKANPDYKGWYESEPVLLPYIGKPVKVVFCKGDDAVFMKEAEVLLKRFLRLSESDHLGDSKWVERYYQACINELGVSPLAIKSPQDVWKFITPQQVFIEVGPTGKYYVTLSCTCDWEKTNGLQLVFREGKKLTRVSGHDGQYEDWN